MDEDVNDNNFDATEQLDEVKFCVSELCLILGMEMIIDY